MDSTAVVIVLAYLVRMVAGPAHGPWIALLVEISMVCAALLFLGGLLRWPSGCAKAWPRCA